MSAEALALLKSIDASLKLLVQRRQASAPKAIAPDRDLDGKFGDPEIKAKDPRDWTGAPMQGRKFSECPADYLDLVADRLDYFADRADEEGKTTTGGKPVSHYNRLDAARARGWAARVRSGRHVPSTPTEPGGGVWASDEPVGAAAGVDDDIPF